MKIDIVNLVYTKSLSPELIPFTRSSRYSPTMDGDDSDSLSHMQMSLDHENDDNYVQYNSCDAGSPPKCDRIVAVGASGHHSGKDNATA